MASFEGSVIQTTMELDGTVVVVDCKSSSAAAFAAIAKVASVAAKASSSYLVVLHSSFVEGTCTSATDHAVD